MRNSIKRKLLFIGLFAPVFCQGQDTIPQAGGTCVTATLVCNKNGLTVSSAANGSVGSATNKPTCSGLPPNQTTYLIFTVKKSGLLNFTITPEDTMSEYDWALYEYTNCGAPGSQPPGEINCNFNTNKRQNADDPRTGMSPNGENNSINPFTKEVTVNSGQTYLLAIDHFGVKDSNSTTFFPPDGDGYTITWGGNFEIEPDLGFNMPNTTFTGSSYEICCAPVDVNFTNNTTYTGGTFQWNFGDSAGSVQQNPPPHTYDPGIYRVSLTMNTSDGCIYVEQKTLDVIAGGYLYIPSAFSPNSDGTNDTLDVISKGVITYSLQIFNRWGQLMFKTDKPSEKWNGGKDNDLSRKAPMGVYVYIAKALFTDSQSKTFTGTIAIVE